MKKQQTMTIDVEIEGDVERMMDITGLSRSGLYEFAVRVLSTYPDKYLMMELSAHRPVDYRKQKSSGDKM